MSIYLKFLLGTLILTSLIPVLDCQKALLLSSSIGYYNIRQISNIVKVYHHLKDNGLTDDDIILMVA